MHTLLASLGRMKWTRSKELSAPERSGIPITFPTSHLESWQQRGRRRRYLRLLMAKSALFFLINSVTLPQTWPYLQSAQPGARKTAAALIVSATPLVRAFSAPLAGWMTRRVSFRWVALVCDLLTCAGGLLWSAAYSAPLPAAWWLLAARAVMGLCGGQLELLMTYVAHGTSSEERVLATAQAGGTIGIGTLLGPGVVALMSYIGTEGLSAAGMRFNQFTVSSLFLTALFTAVTVASCCLFTDSDIAAEESRMLALSHQRYRAQWFGLFVCLLASAHSFGAMRLHESLLVPMMMELYGWEETRALRDAGLVLLLASVVAMAINSLSARASQKHGERPVLIGALLGALISSVLGLPLEELALSQRAPGAGRRSLTLWPELLSASGNSSARCPGYQSWCPSAARLPFSQLVACVILTAASAAVLFTSAGATFSRLLPASGQGPYWGLMGACANVGRSVYPVAFTAVYSQLGPQMTYLGLTGVVSVLLLMAALSYNQLVPPVVPPVTHDNNNCDPSVQWYKQVYSQTLSTIMEDLASDLKQAEGAQRRRGELSEILGHGLTNLGKTARGGGREGQDDTAEKTAVTVQ
ncbi:major facilitator superfamily domain-containing protein 8-like [Amphibalanus amphitrite]|uniref:major facilitator superfamily domain-containing protein 8-like n=1 Tax=Amphibalanus amphitrite TaxID=1232801 RepID=UPI001C92585C|nr:major facilitator superfamily domain-containing protein 8-like [Amphibalanus amphitrite]